MPLEFYKANWNCFSDVFSKWYYNGTYTYLFSSVFVSLAFWLLWFCCWFFFQGTVLFYVEVFLLLLEGEVHFYFHTRRHKQGQCELMHCNTNRGPLPTSLPLPQDGTQSQVWVRDLQAGSYTKQLLWLYPVTVAELSKPDTTVLYDFHFFPPRLL